MYGKDGLGIAFIVWLIIWQLDKCYYKKKQELLRKRLQIKKERSARPEEKILQETMLQENECDKKAIAGDFLRLCGSSRDGLCCASNARILGICTFISNVMIKIINSLALVFGVSANAIELPNSQQFLNPVLNFEVQP